MHPCKLINRTVMALRRAVIRAEDKQRIYDAFNRSEDYLQFAEQMGIKRQTAYAIVRRTESRDGAVALQRGGQRRTRIDEELTAAARDIVLEHPAFTLNQINHELRQRMPHKPQISRTTLAGMLEASLISVKKWKMLPRKEIRKPRRNSVAITLNGFFAKELRTRSFL